MNKPTLGAGSLALVGLLFIGIILLANTLLRGAQIDLTQDRLLHALRWHEEHPARAQGAGESLPVLLGQHRDADSRHQELRHARARAARIAWPRAPTASSRSRSSIRSPSPRKKTAPPSSACRACPSMPAATSSTSASPRPTPPTARKRSRSSTRSSTNSSSTTSPSSSTSCRPPKSPWSAGCRRCPWAANSTCAPGGRRPALMVYGQIEQLYTVRAIDPSVTSIDADVDVLVLVHPKDLPPAALYAIDQFAMRGGHVLAFVDPNAQADQSGDDPEQPDGAVHGRQVLAPRAAARLLGRGVQARPGGRRPGARPGGRRCAKANRPRSTSPSSASTPPAWRKDVITARLDSINMATAGSLKPLAGQQAHVRAADPHQQARRACCPRSASR